MLQAPHIGNHKSSNGNGHDSRLIEGVVSNLPLFRNVSRTHVMLVASFARIEYHPRGAQIARRGEHLPGVIGVGYGLVKLVLPRQNGEGKVLRFLAANETFGEAVAFLERPCSLDLVALADTMLAVMPVRPLHQLQEHDSTFAANLVKILAEGQVRLVHEIDASVRRSSAQRLAAYLHSLAASDAGPDACAVRLPVTKSALAAHLGITKETMSRLLRGLKDQGLILMQRGNITILDRARLSGIAQ